MELKKKVLLVDDVKLFLRLEETFFRRTGCDIFTAESGEQAIELAREHRPDLVLLDYIMPDMMGDQVIEKLKTGEETRSIPIMIVSTSAEKKDVEKCFAAGADEYVTKPINAQEILSKAANILSIPQRIHFRVPVRIRVVGEVEGEEFRGHSRNISRGGMLVECSQSIPAQSLVVMSLPIMEDGGDLRLHGRVVRVDKDESQETNLVGVQFLNLTGNQDQVLQDFLEKNK